MRQSAAHSPALDSGRQVIFESVSTKSQTCSHLLQPITLAVANKRSLRAPLTYCILNSHSCSSYFFPFFLTQIPTNPALQFLDKALEVLSQRKWVFSSGEHHINTGSPHCLPSARNWGEDFHYPVISADK